MQFVGYSDGRKWKMYLEECLKSFSEYLKSAMVPTEKGWFTQNNLEILNEKTKGFEKG